MVHKAFVAQNNRQITVSLAVQLGAEGMDGTQGIALNIRQITGPSGVQLQVEGMDHKAYVAPNSRQITGNFTRSRRYEEQGIRTGAPINR